MGYLDKTFCASPNCNNECGRSFKEVKAMGKPIHLYWFAFFCDENGKKITETNYKHDGDYGDSGSERDNRKPEP